MSATISVYRHSGRDAETRLNRMGKPTTFGSMAASRDRETMSRDRSFKVVAFVYVADLLVARPISSAQDFGSLSSSGCRVFDQSSMFV